MISNSYGFRRMHRVMSVDRSFQVSGFKGLSMDKVGVSFIKIIN